MKRLVIMILAALLTFAVGVAVASFLRARQVQTVKQAQPQPPSQTLSSTSSLPEVAPIAYAEVSSIRAIDFPNFTYPGSTFGESPTYYPEKTFTLRKGNYGEWNYGVTLAEVSYGDVTGDNEEEAIVNFQENTDGSAGVNCVYIFTIENKRPKVLWTFQSGDRAHGGLQRIFARDGKLVLELYGKESSLENLSGTEETAYCCPESFTRTQYQWRERDFQRQGEMEVFPITDLASRP